MAQAKGWADFVLTGCAIVPVITLAFGQPEFALLSHIVLLFTGILLAAREHDAPFKCAEQYAPAATDSPTVKQEGERLQTPTSPALLFVPSNGRSYLDRKRNGGSPLRNRELD